MCRRVDINEIKVGQVVAVMSTIEMDGTFSVTEGVVNNVVTSATGQVTIGVEDTIIYHNWLAEELRRYMPNDIKYFSYNLTPFVMYFIITEPDLTEFRKVSGTTNPEEGKHGEEEGTG